MECVYTFLMGSTGRSRFYMTQSTRIALIPAYKPEPLLTDLLRDVREARLQAVVVDDGGGPEFADLFRCQWQ